MKVTNKMNKEVSALINSMVVGMYMYREAEHEGNIESANIWYEAKEEARAKLIALGFTDLKR